MGFQKVEKEVEHPPCPKSPLFVLHENGMWVFTVTGRLAIPIQCVSGPWRHIVGHTAASIWSCDQDGSAIRAAWLLWISE